MKVTVVGGGIMGLSTAWALTRAGHHVTVLDQGPIPNPAGSSVDRHRLIRHPYGPALGYMRMVVEAYLAWDTLWADLGERHYAPTGTLVLDTTREGWAQQSADGLRSIGLDVEWLEPDAVERRWPLLSTEGVARAFHLDTGGLLFADRIVAALARHLEHRGARLEPHAQVLEIDPLRARAVLGGGRNVEADLLIVAAGAWVARLRTDLARRVTPSRQVVVYVEPPPGLAATWASAPMVLDIAPHAGLYLVPPRLGAGLKIGDHRFSSAGDPDARREAGADEVHSIVDLCHGRLRGFDRYRVAEARVCFYTVEPRERFVVERTDAAWVVSACSGHGFKFGPLLGLALADSVAGARDPGALSRWAAGGI